MIDDILLNGFFFLKASISDHWNHIHIFFTKIHTGCIMNNDHKNLNDAIQHRNSYYTRYFIKQIII